jgi:hypothetical protein
MMATAVMAAIATAKGIITVRTGRITLWPYALARCFAWQRHQDVTEERRKAEDNDDYHQCCLMPAVLSCCIQYAVLRRDDCHSDGPSLLNVTPAFIEHSSGI